MGTRLQGTPVRAVVFDLYGTLLAIERPRRPYRQLLTLLLRRHGEVLSRTVLAEQVWDMNFDSETNVVDVAVRRLRSKLDEPFDRPLLHTVRGMGYVLELRD